MSSKGKASAVLILAAVFLCGSLCGVGGTFYYLKKKRQNWAQHGPRDVYRVQADKMFARLDKALDLSDEQKVAIKKEIGIFSDAAKQLHKDMRPKLRELMSVRTQAIRNHLSPEQIEKFAAMRKRQWDRDRERREKKNGKPAEQKAAETSAETVTGN